MGVKGVAATGVCWLALVGGVPALAGIELNLM
jgi:hypothetical protein